uniref:Uncharacterized protein n=1 Tax=Avena sativa TaxID=4498 RepID=A0ACD5YX61_AVESA
MTREVSFFVLVLFVVSFNHVVASSATSSNYEHSRRLLDHIQVSSFNSSFKVTRTGSKLRASSNQGVDLIGHYCGYRSSEAAYAGAIATMDVYAFPNLRKGELIAAQIWVADNNKKNQVIAGWEVHPERYGDSKTHFYTYWMSDRKDGCSNLRCAGFVPVNLATITPGDTLEPSSGQTSITLKIFKSQEDGHWWLHFGHDINSLNPVGYWPKTLLVNMQDHAGSIVWGGTTGSYNEQISPPMGSGQWPGSNSAASFQNVQYVDVSGQGYDPPGDSLHAIETHRKCYQTGVFRLEVQGNMFYYGGPGGCTT